MKQKPLFERMAAAYYLFLRLCPIKDADIDALSALVGVSPEFLSDYLKNIHQAVNEKSA